METTERGGRISELFEEMGGTILDGFPTIHSPVHRTDAGTAYLKAPGVVMLARPRTNVAGLEGFLEGFDPKLRFTEYLEDPTVLPDSSQLCKTAGQTCFDEKTEILTDEGWKKLKNLNRTERVLTLNPETGAAEFQRPLAYQAYDYEGDLVSCEGKALSFAVTPDHRQWARPRDASEYGFYATEEVERRRFAVRTAPSGWEGEIPARVRVPGPEYEQRVSNQYGCWGRTTTKLPARSVETVEEIRALALLCVYYATEGSLTSSAGGSVVIYGDHRAEISSLAETLGLKTNRWRDPRNGVLRTQVGGGRAMRTFFERECGKGCASKRLPRWVLNLPINLLTDVWDALVKTDGHRGGGGRESFVTTSHEFAGQAQEILCKLGFGSSLARHKTPEDRLQVFVVSRKSRTEAWVNKNARVTRTPYSGKVYCVTTENGIVFVRRNGKPHFSGNCYMSFGPRRTTNENAAAYFERLTSAGHGCYDGETEVLTAAGWKRWPEVSEEDEFATLGPGRKIEYHRPIRLVRYRHEGRMYQVESPGVDLLVTPEHKMYACPTTTKAGREKTDYRLIPCEELNDKSHAYLKTGDWYDVVGGGHLDVYALLGFAVGDGYTVEGSSKIRFRLRRERKIRWLRRTCEDLGWVLRENGDRFTVSVPAEWRGLFSGIYVSEGEKAVPRKLLTTLPKSALRSLFVGLMEADGCRTRTGDCYDTTSPVLAGQIQQICLHLGLAANISQAGCYRERNGSFGNKPVYRAHIVGRNLKPEVNKFAGAAGKTRWIEDWEGEVFCAEVPNNTLYVRRGGKPVWSGNSVLEHSSFSFLLYGISRSVTHELVRHRHLGFSQVSQRYVSGSVLRFVERPEYQKDERLHRLFEERADRAAAEYEEMAGQLLERQEGGNAMLSADYKTDARKKVQQTARSLLPNETEAPMVCTGNVRALRHVVEMRADEHAESEIRALAVRIFLCLAVADPILFGDYRIQALPDGTHKVTTQYRKV